MVDGARGPGAPAGRGPRHGWSDVRRALRLLLVVVVALVGAALGPAVAGGVQRPVGPFDVELSLRLSPDGGTRAEIPPLGSLAVDSHAGPLQVQLRLLQLRPDDARSLAAEPARLGRLGEEIEDDVTGAAVALLVKTAVAAAAGSALLTLLVFRRPPAAVGGAALAVASLAVSAAFARVTFTPAAVVEPRYEGLLASAPAVVGDVRELVEDFDRYRESLGALVTNVSVLYQAGQALPTFTPDPDTLRLLHVSDLHLNPAAFDLVGRLAEQFAVDAVLDTGDLTDWGTAPESTYVDQIGALPVPYVYVRGNHDSLTTQEAVAAQPNATVLDGGVTEVLGLRLLGTGDPRFTPDSATRGSPREEALAVRSHGRVLRIQLRQADPPVDVLLLHDPIVAAETVAGHVPLVLAGHTHQRDRYVVDGTLVMVQGSTGGAGLRGLQGEEPTPLAATVLYVDRTSGALLAHDDVTVGGLGTSSVAIDRTVVTPELLASLERDPADVVPDTGPTPLPPEGPAEAGVPAEDGPGLPGEPETGLPPAGPLGGGGGGPQP